MPGGLALFVRLLDSGFAKPDPQIVGTKLVRGPPYRHRVKIVSRLLLDIHGNPLSQRPHHDRDSLRAIVAASQESLRDCFVPANRAEQIHGPVSSTRFKDFWR